MNFLITAFVFSLAIGTGVWAFFTMKVQKTRLRDRLDFFASKKHYQEKVLKAVQISPKKFYKENFLFLTVPLVFVAIGQHLAPSPGPIAVKFMAALAISMALKFFLKFYMIRRHRQQIESALPSTLDLLVVCLEAGMSLNASLVRLAEETKGTPLSNELRYTFYEINVGLPAEDAFRNLAVRTKVPDVKSFVTTIIESEKMGMKLGDSLRNHSTLLRESIRIRTREKILKLPIQLLFPLIFCIMPSIFVVLLMPSLLRIIPMFANISQ
jgi:tight adherence protein C